MELSQIVGREDELLAMARLFDSAQRGPAALLLEGEAGIGKTTLWRAGLRDAEGRSFRILSSEPARSERRLSYVALRDLLDPVLDETLPNLPRPQRRGLEVALLRRTARGGPADRHVVGAAVLRVIQQVASEGPLLVAIDGAQWMDPASAWALRFALRRVHEPPVGALVTLLSGTPVGEPLDLDATFLDAPFDLVRLQPLSVGALKRVIDLHLGEVPRRPQMTQLHETSGGNPFFALEIARAMVRTGDRDAGPRLFVPEGLRALVRDRLQSLPTSARPTLLGVAALSQPTVGQVRRTFGARGVRAVGLASDAGILAVTGDRISFSHPLLASVAYLDAPPEARRRMHRRLARSVEDAEERARHLANWADGPDEEVALALDDGARKARDRGAPVAAAELAESAARLTPDQDDAGRHRRLIEAARYRIDAADPGGAEALLRRVLEERPGRFLRADALLGLGTILARGDRLAESRQLLEEARDAAGKDARRRCEIEGWLAWVAILLGDFPGAEPHSRRALRLAAPLEDPLLLLGATSAAAFVQFLLGQGVPEPLFDRAASFDAWADRLPFERRPDALRAAMAKWIGAHAEARRRYEAVRQRLEEHGDEASLPVLAYSWSELEAWAGRWEHAEELALLACEATADPEQHAVRGYALYATALIDAFRGRVEPARRNARAGLDLALRSATGPGIILNTSVLAFVELSLASHDAVHELLAPAAQMLMASGIAEPGIFRFLPDEIEALVALGKSEDARPLLDWLQERGSALDRPWALAVAARSRGAVALASGDTEAAIRAAEASLGHLALVEEPFDRGRALLLKGQAERRARQWGAARRSLEAAAQSFDRLGAPLWLERSRRELARVGGRPPAPIALTATEQRVAELIAEGHTTRQVAERLFASPKTVEANLAKVYRKLGVRSRAELGSRISAAASPGR